MNSTRPMELVLRMLELKRPVSLRHGPSWEGPPPGAHVNPDDLAGLPSGPSLGCAIPIFSGTAIVGALVLEAAEGTGGASGPGAAGPGSQHAAAAAAKAPGVAPPPPPRVPAAPGPLLAVPGALQQLSLAASLAFSADAEEIGWLAGALRRVAGAEGMQGLVELLGQLAAEHVGRRFTLAPTVRVALMPHPHAATGMLFHTPAAGGSGSGGGGGGGGGGGAGASVTSSPAAAASWSSQRRVGVGVGGGLGGRRSCERSSALRSGGEREAAARLNGASQRRLLPAAAASVTGSDCGTAASRTPGQGSYTSDRQPSLSAPTRSSAAAAAAGAVPPQCPAPARTVVVQLPPHLAPSAPPPSLHAQAFLLKHTLLQAMALAAGGAAPEAPPLHGICIDDVGAHVHNVHKPSRDVCMLMGAGGAAGAAGAAGGSVCASTGGCVRSSAADAGARPLRPCSASSIGSTHSFRGGGAGSLLQSLVLLGVPLGGGAVLGLYLCFPRRLPGALLEAVRTSGQALLEQVFAGPVQALLAGPLAPEYEALRASTPGSFAVLRSQTASGLLQRPASGPLAGGGAGAAGGGGVAAGGLGAGGGAIGKSPLSGRLGALLLNSARDSPPRPGAASPEGDGSGGGGGGDSPVPLAAPNSSDLLVIAGFASPALPKGLSLTRGASFSHDSRSTAPPPPPPVAATIAAAHSAFYARRWQPAPGPHPATTPFGRRTDPRVGEPRGSPPSVAAAGRDARPPLCAPPPPPHHRPPHPAMAVVDHEELLGALVELHSEECSAGGIADAPTTEGGVACGHTGAGVSCCATDVLSASVMTISGVDAAASKRQHLDLLLRSMHATAGLEGERDVTTNWDDLEELVLSDVLGKGGGGVVFRGRLGTQDVAVKVMELPDVDILDSLSSTGMGTLVRLDRPTAAGGDGLAAAPGGGQALVGSLCAGVGGGSGAGAEAGLRAGLPLRPAAVALLAKEQLKARKALLRNATEMAVHGQISHPNLLQVYATYPNVVLAQRPGLDGGVLHCLLPAEALPLDACQPGPTPTCCAIVMELADSGCLAAALTSHAFPPPPPPAAPPRPPQHVDMRSVYLTLLDVALALRHLHACGLVHRDVKPANLLLRSAPRDPRGFSVKLADFGFVLRLGEAGADGARYAIADQACGTVTHMAPEAMVAEARITAAADVYSFGILMWELLAGGSRPFPHLPAEQIPRQVAAGARPVFAQAAPLPYRSLAAACWAADPAARPRASDLVSLINGFLQDLD